jgi:hypothetical protein
MFVLVPVVKAVVVGTSVRWSTTPARVTGNEFGSPSTTDTVVVVRESALPAGVVGAGELCVAS